MNSGVDRQRAYWNERLTRSLGPAGTGMEAYGDPFNWWMVQVERVRFHRVAGRLGLPLGSAEILDVGCGTGFALEEWMRLGARRLTGIDIAPAAIARLRAELPDCAFIEGDIGQDPNPLETNRYVAASAFAVLFHIVDEARYMRALVNIHAALVPGGWFIFSDNFVHAPRPPMGDYHVCRTRDVIERALDETGFEVLDRLPLFVLMGDPVDSDNRWLHRYWRVLSWLVMRSHAAGGALGGALFPLELLLTRFLRESPTTEVMVCRKTPAIDSSRNGGGR